MDSLMSDITSNKFDHCSKLLQISKLNTKTTCSKYDTSEKFIDTKNNKVDILKTEFSEVETERRLNEYKNVLDNNSNYEIYDENNNCMLTNLKEFGLHFFDTNAEIKKDNFNIDKYVNDSSSDLDIFFDTASSQKLENVDSRESEYDETYNDKNININDVGICSDILVDNSKIESNIKTNFKYEANTEADEAESDENIKSDFRRLYNPIDSDKIFEIGIEDNLKCNFIAYENYNKIRIERENADIDEDSQIKDCIDVNTVQDAVTPQVQAAICLNTNQSDDSDTCSYHSSDFEFIDESEAFNGCTEGLMYNLNPSTNGIKNNSQVTVDISRELHTNIMKIENDYYNKPGVSKNYVIPRGDDYNNLFQHHCVPYPSRNIENKAVHSMKGMNVCDARFDIKFLLRRRDSNSKLKEEADESAKIIVSMYPYENKRISLRAKDK